MTPPKHAAGGQPGRALAEPVNQQAPEGAVKYKTGEVRADGLRYWCRALWVPPHSYLRYRASTQIAQRRWAARADKGEQGHPGPNYQRPCGAFREDGFRWLTCCWHSPGGYKRSLAANLIKDRRLGGMKKGLDVSGLDAKGPHYKELVDIIAFGKSILSNIPFNHEGGRTWDSASIDQKEAGKGYAWENIRVVLHAENNALGTWGKDIMFYVQLNCLLRECQKRGDPEATLAVLRELASRYKPTNNESEHAK